MTSDQIVQARRLVNDRFPDALAAVLAGSAASGRATASSDLDIAVLMPEDGATYRETVRFEDRVVELFVHTQTGLTDIFAVDAASRRAVAQSMYATGRVLLDPHGHGARARARARAKADLLDGPPALDPEAVDTKRYGLTDLLTDLTDPTDSTALTDPTAPTDLADTRDRIEELAVAGAVLSAAADLLCDHRRAWVGSGKWFARRLREADGTLGQALFEGHRRLCHSGDPALLARAAEQVLDLVGAPLSVGCRRTWRGVAESAAGR
ncbi:nucleotidyltransferase domain-containing protein [Kitasatospora sp. NPDC059795]|uniref:nucleotidyltransferase domain-containing protein n=1 Tax=Kitasatospora sp. NPDC059795 TaxID=3346949 RepID=UPI003668811C